jgi:DNA-binding GntR family transcriptional regulator
MPLKTPIVAVSLREQVYNQLCEAIMRGEYAPGDVLKISAIAEVSQTSLVPVREAMQNLAAEGAIEMLHNRSARIPKTSREDYRQLTAIRMSLEGMAAEEAAANLTDADIDYLVHTNAGMAEAVMARDTEKILPWNREFHFTIYDRARSPILSRLIKTLWLRAGPILNASLTGSVDGMSLHHTGLAEHEAIIEAARNRDAAALKAKIMEDIFCASTWYVKYYDFERI